MSSSSSDDSEIALFTVTFSHLHYNVFERGCEAISGNFVVSARNCITSMFKNIVMQMRKGNCEKGYCSSSIMVKYLFRQYPLKHCLAVSTLILSTTGYLQQGYGLVWAELTLNPASSLRSL